MPQGGSLDSDAKGMKLLPVMVASFVCLGLVTVAPAQEVRLELRQRPGDVYQLDLSTRTETEARSQSPERRTFEEEVTLTYRARVEVLEVDEAGRAVVERHQRVELTFDRPDGSGSLFPVGTSYEARLDSAGRWQLWSRSGRLAGDVERVVGDVLGGQLERTELSRWIDPGRPVAVGERWELAEEAARGLFRSQGLRLLKLERPATATLHRASPDGRALEVRYRVEAAWCEPLEVPVNTSTGRTGAVLEGEVSLSGEPHGRPVAHQARLETEMRGVIDKRGVARPVAWRVERSARTDQTTRWEAFAGSPDAVASRESAPASIAP